MNGKSHIGQAAFLEPNGNAFHAILTPFYVRRQVRDGAEAVLASKEWLEERIELFERYCLPTVASQTTTNFAWLLFIDENSPAPQVEKIRTLLQGHPNFHLVHCDRWSEEVISAALRRIVPSGKKYILTTRLDNDDGISRGFVESLQDSFNPGRFEFLNFPQGVILWRQKTFRYTHQSNAFLSLSEKIESCRTVYCTSHENAVSITTVRQIPVENAFLQVVHGGNVSNKPRGIRVQKSRALSNFCGEAIRRQEGNESNLSILAFNMVFYLPWTLRDALVNWLKRLLRLLRKKEA